MEQETPHDALIRQLEILNTTLEKQNKGLYQVRQGLLYGIGFFVGSAVFATILLGILGPLFGKIQWVHDSYQAGEEILK